MIKKNRKGKADRAFDFSLYPTRNMCLKVAYHGHNYDGLAKQDHTANTVETLLVDALKRVRLINPVPACSLKDNNNDEKNAETEEGTTSTNASSLPSWIQKIKADAAEKFVAAARSNGHNYTTDAASLTESMHLQPDQFSRCGRTDKGVSALGNAFSCRMRVSKEGEPPLDYCKMINMALPNTIRVIGWAYVHDTFDARFSCIQRTYRYFMHLGGLNVAKMEEALDMLVGSHDFRNFCKMDIINIGCFVRNILSARIVPLCNVQFFDDKGGMNSSSSSAPPTPKANDMSIGYLEIVGNAFLYHQIRCTVTILILIGKGLEEPSVIRDLLDVERYPSKPCYPLADDAPLVLWDCEFSSLTFDQRTNGYAVGGGSTEGSVSADIAVVEPLQWNLSEEARWVIEQELRDITTSLLIRSSVAVSMHQQIRAWATTTKTVPAGGDSDVVAQAIPCYPVTGVDWTNGKAPVGATKRQAMGCSWEEAFIGGGNTRTNTYVPLLSRPMEKTYEQKVKSLSGQKRERQETNASKRESVGKQ